MNYLRPILLLALAILTTGCASLGERDAIELGWQTLNALDTAQTIHITRAPACFHEKAPITRELIGKHPREGEVVAIMAAYAVGHYYLSRRLEGRWLTAFQVVSVLIAANNVINNQQIGLRPFGSGCP